MREFVELDVSIFDPAFTLTPYTYLADLYHRDRVIGFASEGMRLLFKFEDCRAVMHARDFQLIFGGSVHTCIGVRLSTTFLKHRLTDLLKYMPDKISVIESEIEVDGSWLAERIVTKMPLLISWRKLCRGSARGSRRRAVSRCTDSTKSLHEYCVCLRSDR